MLDQEKKDVEQPSKPSLVREIGRRLNIFFNPPAEYDGHVGDGYAQICYLAEQLSKIPSGYRHAKAYEELRNYCIDHQDDLLEVLKSKTVADEEVSTLVWIGGHGGSIALEHNLSWLPFLQRVWSQRESMPESVVRNLEWWFDVHAPGLSESSSPTKLAILFLESTLLGDETFNVERTRDRLSEMRESGKLTDFEYMNLLDAANNFAREGHFKNSLIYKRAEHEELDQSAK